MPAMHYTVRWPDGSESLCYSPSLVIQESFELGYAYPLADFMRRIRAATAIANDRVQAKFGFTCSRASAQLDELESRARRFVDHRDAHVRLLDFAPADA